MRGIIFVIATMLVSPPFLHGVENKPQQAEESSEQREIAERLIIEQDGQLTEILTAKKRRSFFMGTTPFFMTPRSFPEFIFENLETKDMLSLHVDDFFGIPWKSFRDGTSLPLNWELKWEILEEQAHASGKTLYLALSPLGGRKTLAPDIDATGTRLENSSSEISKRSKMRFCTSLSWMRMLPELNS